MSAEAAAAALAAMTMKTAVKPAPKMDKGKKGIQKQVVTNSYPGKLAPNLPFFMHDYRVNAVFLKRDGSEKLMEVTKQTRDDYTEQERKKVALATYQVMKEIGAIKGDFIYDRAALLVAMKKIPQCEGGAEYVTVLTRANAVNLFKMDRIKEAKEIRVTIKKATDNYQVSTNDLQSKDEATRLALKTIVDLGTSQGLFERTDEFIVYGTGAAYLLNPKAHGFPDSFDAGTPDKYGGVGLTKGARFVEGPNGQMAVAVTLDPKKSNFHKDFQKISDKLRDNNCSDNPMQATQQLAGLKCLVFYNGVPKEQQRAREITIGMMGRDRVKDIVFEDANGKRTTLPQYVLTKYKTKIENTNAYVIIDKYEGNKYAPENLLVAPNQRMKTENSQPANIEKLIKQSATLPAIRQAETATLVRALDISETNAAQARRGITVNTAKPMTVMARVLGTTMLGSTVQGKESLLPVNGQWRQGKIAQVPLARFSKWTIVHVYMSNGYESADLANATASALKFVAKKDLGYEIDMPNCIAVALNGSDQEGQLQAIMAAEKAAGAQFVLVIANKAIKNHAMIKFLEIKNDIITEQLTSNIAQQIPNKPNTASNVILKICEKLGGQTHYISKSTPDLPSWITMKGTMIVGLQMEHPSALSGKEKEANAMPSRPVFIGFSSNAVRGATARVPEGAAAAVDAAAQEKENTHFSADWGYAMSKDYKGGEEYYQSYKDTVLNILRSFKLYRGCIPRIIVLFRGGVNEGDYQKVRNEEVAIWEAAFKTLNAAYNPSFIVMTVNEMHSDRFYQEKIPVNEKAPKQNLPSGTVIDSGVTNPALAQFFLQSHVPLQGTAKVPSYVVQHVGLNPAHKLTVTLDDLQKTSHALCFSHGVCNTPTAVPTPLYVAQESMKRASELFAYWQHRGSGVRGWKLEDVRKELTRDPETSNIHGLRVNA